MRYLIFVFASGFGARLGFGRSYDENGELIDRRTLTDLGGILR